MKQQRRGWLWLMAGIVLALVAGLFTFRIINDVTQTASLGGQQSTDTVPILVANIDIQPNQALDESMFVVREIPRNLAPSQAITSIDQVANKIATGVISAGELIYQNRLVDPADPNAPILYTIEKSKVLVAVPASVMLGKLGMLQPGDRIDIAYTAQLDSALTADPQAADQNASNQTGSANDYVAVTFLSLQNLEIKALPRLTGLEEKSTIVQPDAILLAVTPQEALILKYLLDTGAAMEVFLRAPGNDTLAPVLPVDQRYLVERFQLHLDAPADLIRLPDAQNAGLDFGSTSQGVNATVSQGSQTFTTTGQSESNSTAASVESEP